MENEEKQPAKILSSTTGLSLTLVIAIIGGIVANLKMISDMGERYARVDATLSSVTGDIGEIKVAINSLNSTIRKDIKDLRKENNDIRERLSRLEAQLKMKSQ